MKRRVGWLVVLAALTGASQPAVAQAEAAEASVSVPREVLERYVGRYALNGTIATVVLTEDGRLTLQLTGQPAGLPLRAVGVNEFLTEDAVARVFFEGDGPQTNRIRSWYMGGVAVGTRIADGAPVAQSGFPATLDPAARRDAVGSLASALRQQYVFPDVGERAALHIEAALAAGEYDGLADPGAFAARLSTDVGAVANDKHLRVMALGAPPPPPPSPSPRGMAPLRLEAGVVRADKLAGGIGYIEVAAFPRLITFKPVIDRALASLSDSKALIIDLRRNGGGDPAGEAYMVGFLLPPDKPVHINDIVMRVAGTKDFTRESFFSQPTPVSFAGRPVYVLTSSGTFSGGEAFAYDVKALGLGVLVGELTGGGANPAGPAPLGNGLLAAIPSGRAESAVTKTNWEHHGVDPDIAVPAADALGVALEKLGQPGVSDIASASRQQVFAPRTTQLPGSEPALRKLLASVVSGTPDYAAMSPEAADMLRQQLPQLQETFRPLGEIKSIRFVGRGFPAGDAFDVIFASQTLAMTVMLGPDGSIIGWLTNPSGG